MEFNIIIMKINLSARILVIVLGLTLHHDKLYGQLLPIDSFVLYSGPNGVGTTLIGSSIFIKGGSVGAIKLVQTTGNATINSNIHSGDKVIITNSNIIGGKITAANSSGSLGTVLSVGSSTNISGNIDVNGNIVIGGGIVQGTVTLPVGKSYIGPVPAGDTVFGPPSLPILPTAFPETTFPALTAGTPFNIFSTQTINPGFSYGAITFGGNKTLTLNGPGVYVFNSFTWTGNSNKLVFDFRNTGGTFYIYIHGNADFGKLNSIIANSTSDANTIAGRIFIEVHGDGNTSSIPGNSFIVANGSSGGGSKSYGTVYATRGGINIGAGTGSSDYTGALHSIKSVTLQSGVSVVYAPFLPCNPPNLTTGIPSDTDPFIIAVDTVPLDFTGKTILTAKSTTPGVSFQWSASNGGVIITNNTQPTITVSALGTYTVKAYTNNLTCFATDSVIVGKVPNIIGAELLSIYRNYDADTPDPDLDSFFVTKNGYVTIDIICKVDTQIVINLLTQPQYGLILYYPPGPPYFGQRKYPSGLSKRIITGDIPIANLLLLNELRDYLNFCRTYYRPTTNAGAILSQGDTTIRSYLVRKGYHLDGKGIKIGIMSDSYGTLIDPSKTFSDPCANVNQTLNVNSPAADLISGDVPNVTVVQDHPLILTDEGRAMAGIVHDIAPGADILFRTGFFTEGDLAFGMQQLAAAGCKVIIDDITFVTALMLKDGVAAKTVNNLTAQQKVFHSTSAGNFGNKSYEKNFNPVDATSIGFPGKMAHNFGSSNSQPDFFQKVMLRPGDHLFVFQWADLVYSNDELAGTQFDLDIFLCPGDKTDGTSLISFPRDNQFGDPIEFIPIRIPGNGACDTVAKPYNILIVNHTTTGNPSRIKYIDFKGAFRAVEYNEGGTTISGHANADSAFTVGAVRFNHVPKHPLLPAALSAITKPQIESFSSVGGTFVNGVQKFKPDAAGPDGVDVTVLMGQDYPNQALNQFPNFFGTSAASPHVGALAALLIQARDSFLHQSTTPFQLKSLFKSTAVDMRPTGLVGYDFSAGAGLINADAAMRTFAVPEPFEIRLLKPTNIIPCQDPFTLTIVGENFNSTSKVYLVNGPNDTTKISPTYISASRDTIKVTITSCVGNPEIFVFTPSTAGLFKLDGGLSNSIRLFDQEIVVQTINTSKKYGQVTPVPSFTATLIDNGVSTIISPADYAKYGLVSPNLKVKPFYGLYTPVGTYPDTVYREFKYPDDTALTNHYRYIFKGGVLTIEKMPLTVTPNTISPVQNQFIGPITFTYSFPSDQPANPGALRDTAQKYHEAFLLANALALVKDFKMAQAGGYVLSEADLANMSTMLTINALKNSRKFKIVNNQLVPETDPNSLQSQYIVDIASQSIFDYTTSPDTAKFYEGYPGISKKALLGQTPLENNKAAVEIVNGQTTTLQPLINGHNCPVLNAEGITRLAPLVNGQFITVLDGQLATLNSSTGQLAPIPNSPKIQYLNSVTGIGSLIYLVNGQAVTLAIGSSVPLTNGGQLVITEANSFVKIPNLVSGLHLTNAIGGTPTLQTLINGVGATSLQPLINTSNIKVSNGGFVNGATPTLQTLINGTLIALNGGTGLSTLAILVNGVSATLQPLVNGVIGISSLSALVNSFQINLAVANGVVATTLQPLVNNGPGGGGGSANNNAVIVDQTDVNPLTYNYLGNMFAINMITGFGPGIQYIVPGTLKNANFDITYVTGRSITVDSTCLITRSPFNNFGSTPTPKSPTTLWVNIEAKISGQLAKRGDYVLYTGGSITLNDINATDPVTNALITTKVLPDGMIIADAVPAPTTHYDAAQKLWITRIPIGFSSTSDIFLSGGVIQSKDGFEKKKNNANSNTVLRGIFYSNTNISDQWTYALATYRTPVPYAFDLASVSAEGQIVAINGGVLSYRAGTPLPHLTYLVNGASGGGGNNYTGSTSSYDKFILCQTAAPGTPVANPIANMSNEIDSAPKNSMLQIYPNPASDILIVSFVPELTSNSRITLFTIDGRKTIEINNGITEAGKLYLRSIDVGKLGQGVYLVQISSGNKITSKKIVISR